MMRKRKDELVRKKNSSSDPCPVNNILSELSNLGLKPKKSNYIRTSFKQNSKPGEWKSSEAKKCAYNVTTKEIDGEIFISQKYKQYSVTEFERLIKLEKQSQKCIPLDGSQRCLLKSILPVDSKSKEEAETEDNNLNANLELKVIHKRDSPHKSTSSSRDSILPDEENSNHWLASTTSLLVWNLAFVSKQIISLRISSRKFIAALSILGLVIVLHVFVSISLYKTTSSDDVDMNNSIFRETRSLLEERLFGQHLVVNKLSMETGTFLADPVLRTGIFLLFGSSGSGKTLTSNIIQEILRNKGFVVLEWQLSAKELPDLKNICGKLSQANSKRFVLVLEDLDKIEEDRIFETKIISQLKKCQTVEKIFVIITSTMFSADIKDFIFKQYANVANRTDITEKDLFNELNDRSTLFGTINILQSHPGIKFSMFPFLLLEKEQVKMCIKMELIRRRLKKESWNKLIAQALQFMYFYDRNTTHFSESGCKLVKSRVDYVLN